MVIFFIPCAIYSINKGVFFLYARCKQNKYYNWNYSQMNHRKSSSIPIPTHLCKLKSEYDSELIKKWSQNTQSTHKPPGHTNTRRKGLRRLINIQHAVRRFTCSCCRAALNLPLTVYPSVRGEEEREREKGNKTQCRVKPPLSLIRKKLMSLSHIMSLFHTAYFLNKSHVLPLCCNEHELSGQKSKTTNAKLKNYLCTWLLSCPLLGQLLPWVTRFRRAVSLCGASTGPSRISHWEPKWTVSQSLVHSSVEVQK